jgi:exosortase
MTWWLWDAGCHDTMIADRPAVTEMEFDGSDAIPIGRPLRQRSAGGMSRAGRTLRKRRGQLRRTLPSLALGIVTVILSAPALLHSVNVWSTTEEFSFGFLVVPVAAVLAWPRRRALLDGPAEGSALGLSVVVVAVGTYVIAERVGINAVAGLAIPPMLWGMVLYVRGWTAAKTLALPIGYLAFGLGLYRGLLDNVGFALQGITASAAALGASALQLGVSQDGFVLRGSDFAFVVSQPCSGMSSLVSLLALSTLWVSLASGGLVARAIIVAAVLPVVIVANGARVTIVLAVASAFGQDAALGFFHGASSFVLFGFAIAGLLGVGWLVGCKAPTFGR